MGIRQQPTTTSITMYDRKKKNSTLLMLNFVFACSGCCVVFMMNLEARKKINERVAHFAYV